MSGTVARLGTDVESICPELSDREDENEIQRLFCFILADQSREGDLLRRDVLGTEDFVLPLFCDPGRILLLHTQAQPHHTQHHNSQPHNSQATNNDEQRIAIVTIATVCEDSPDISANGSNSVTNSDKSITMESASNNPIHPTIINHDHMIKRSITTATNSAPSLPGRSLDIVDGKNNSFVCHTSVDVSLDNPGAEPCE